MTGWLPQEGNAHDGIDYSSVYLDTDAINKHYLRA